MLKRLEFWDTKSYSDFLLVRARQPFQWGSNDCALFVADGIQAMTGVDIADDFRGKYATEAEAFTLIETVTGGTTIADAAAWCAAKFGLPELRAVLGAGRGDMVIVQDMSGPVCGLVHPNGRDIVVVGEAGLRRRSMLFATRAWRV